MGKTPKGGGVHAQEAETDVKGSGINRNTIQRRESFESELESGLKRRSPQGAEKIERVTLPKSS